MSASEAPGALQGDAARDLRIARADRYYAEDLRDQRGWYSRKASGSKQWAQRLGLIIIACGALTTFLQILEAALWVRIATGVLGIIVAVAQGSQRIWKFDETWQAYRIASEQMKRERRLYINAAGGYAAIADEDAAYRAFVVAVEQIMAEEQQIYWKDRGESFGAERKSAGAATTEEKPPLDSPLSPESALDAAPSSGNTPNPK